jgi:hypothetical protein
VASEARPLRVRHALVQYHAYAGARGAKLCLETAISGPLLTYPAADPMSGGLPGLVCVALLGQGACDRSVRSHMNDHASTDALPTRQPHSPQPIASTSHGPPTDQARPRVNRRASAGRTGPALKGRYIPAQGANPGYRVYPPPKAPCRGATYCTSHNALCPRPFRGRGMGGYAVPPGRCPISANYFELACPLRRCYLYPWSG